MRLAKIVKGDWIGWYGSILKQNDSMTKLKIDACGENPLMIFWIDNKSIDIHSFAH